jgi:hypothetical protein
LIQRATEGRVNFQAQSPSLTAHRLPLPCPRDFERFFTTQAPRDVVETFLKGEPAIIGTTHLEPTFALGSVNRGDLWNQRRPLVAYWGTADKPSYLRVRFLHDGYDFSAGQFFSVQKTGRVLAGINLATDGGDTHVSLDRIKDATIKAKDLRLRFEFGGEAANASISAPAKLHDPVNFNFDNVMLELMVPFAVFEDRSLHWETNHGPEQSSLDLVLYHGEEISLDLSKVNRAGMGIALVVNKGEAQIPKARAVVIDEGESTLALEWSPLHLSLPVRPAKAAELQKAYKAWQDK